MKCLRLFLALGLAYLWSSPSYAVLSKEVSRESLDSVCSQRAIYTVFPFEGDLKFTFPADVDAFAARAKRKGIPEDLVREKLNKPESLPAVGIVCADPNATNVTAAVCLAKDQSLDECLESPQATWLLSDTPSFSARSDRNGKKRWQVDSPVFMMMNTEDLKEAAFLLEEDEERAAPFHFEFRLTGQIETADFPPESGDFGIVFAGALQNSFPGEPGIFKNFRRHAANTLSESYKQKGWMRAVRAFLSTMR